MVQNLTFSKEKVYYFFFTTKNHNFCLCKWKFIHHFCNYQYVGGLATLVHSGKINSLFIFMEGARF